MIINSVSLLSNSHRERKRERFCQMAKKTQNLPTSIVNFKFIVSYTIQKKFIHYFPNIPLELMQRLCVVLHNYKCISVLCRLCFDTIKFCNPY
jgi:hypothetical protein